LAFFRATLFLVLLAPVWPLGAPLFWLAPFFEEAFLQRDVRALFRKRGGFNGCDGF
jgi:hypothetical protein